ncbi:MAG TPA: GNAT family N-acetyltransferase [Casimicrobiaceae bacterium]|nr:GNAT family N-acetyltransferase [Casimicrobiaceae bacterium]
MLPERALAYPVTLRPFGLRDAPRVQLLAGEREVAAMTALIPHPYPDGAAEAWIAGQVREQAAGQEYTYAVTSSDDGTLVGAIGLRPVATEHGNLGFWIGRPYWGRGYATTAARAVIALAFGLLEIDALTAAHLARNPASGRVMEKCGMRLLGTEKRNHRGVQEEFCVRGITRDDWERLIAMDAA